LIFDLIVNGKFCTGWSIPRSKCRLKLNSLNENFSEKTLLFEAEIYVPGYAQNAGFCTIYPRSSGGLERQLMENSTCLRNGN
jgi:hypothetical protein